MRAKGSKDCLWFWCHRMSHVRQVLKKPSFTSLISTKATSIQSRSTRHKTNNSHRSIQVNNHHLFMARLGSETYHFPDSTLLLRTLPVESGARVAGGHSTLSQRVDKESVIHAGQPGRYGKLLRGQEAATFGDYAEKWEITSSRETIETTNAYLPLKAFLYSSTSTFGLW